MSKKLCTVYKKTRQTEKQRQETETETETETATATETRTETETKAETASVLAASFRQCFAFELPSTCGRFGSDILPF